jgi:hypothetical protein
MLQDEEEDLIIDHTATSTYLSDSHRYVTFLGQNVHRCCAAEILVIHTIGIILTTDANIFWLLSKLQSLNSLSTDHVNYFQKYCTVHLY